MSAFHARFLHRLLLLAGACGLTAGCYRQVEAQEPLRTAEGPVAELVRIESKGLITFFAIAPDGKALAYSESVYLPDNKGWTDLVLLDLTTGKELRRGRGSFTTGGVFSPDGKLLAVGSVSTKGTLWDVEQWKPKLDLKIPDKFQSGIPLAFSPDGKSIAGSSHRKELRYPSGSATTYRHILWDAATGQYRQLGKIEEKPQKEISWQRVGTSFTGISDYVAAKATAATFAEDGSPFLFAEYGSYTVVWGLAQDRPLQDLPGGCGWFRGCRTTPNGRTLVLPRYKQLPIAAGPFSNPKFVEDGVISVVAALSGRPCGAGYAGAPIKELWRSTDFKSSQSPARFPPRYQLSPDGNRLVAVGITPENEKKEWHPSTLVVWDVSGLHAAAAKLAWEPTREERDRWWACLFEEDPHAQPSAASYGAHRAMFSLVANPKEAVPYLRKNMGPPSDMKRIPKLIEDLGSEEFKTREQATQELESLGQAAAPFLEKALAKNPSPEARRRLERLLEKTRANAVGDELRMLRIIDVLEHVNTPEAREVLQTIAKGGYGPSFAEEAKKALQRAGEKSK